jgi:hypothetical protein
VRAPLHHCTPMAVPLRDPGLCTAARARHVRCYLLTLIMLARPCLVLGAWCLVLVLAPFAVCCLPFAVCRLVVGTGLDRPVGSFLLENGRGPS